MHFIPVTLYWIVVVIEAVKAHRWRRSVHVIACGVAMVALAANLLWNNSHFTMTSGAVALVALAVSLYGCRENVRDFYIYWIAGTE